MDAPREGLLSRYERAPVAVGLVAVGFLALAIERVIRPVGDQDSFWIAAAGREMWRNGHVPRTNAFSFTDPLHEWVFHEMAFGLLYAKGLAALGAGFLDLFGVLAGALTLAVAVFHITRTTRHRLTLAVVLLPLLIEVPLVHPRPPFASLGLVAAMTALAFSTQFGVRHAVAAVALEWIWTVSHGSFPLGVLILLAAAGASARLDGPDPAPRRRNLLLAALAAAAVTWLNPYGGKLHGLVASYIAGDDDIVSAVHEHITEFLPIWRMPNQYGSFDVPVLALVAGVALSCVVRRREVVPALLVLALSALAVLHVRNISVAVLLGAMLLAPEVDRGLPLAGDAPMTRASLIAALSVLPGTAASSALWAYLMATRPATAWLGANVGGPDLLPIVARVPDGARVYAPFGISPAILWYGAPRGLRVFFDARNDCYAPGVLLASVTLEDEGATPALTLASYGTEYAVVRRGGPVAHDLLASTAWQLVEERGALELFHLAPGP